MTTLRFNVPNRLSATFLATLILGVTACGDVTSPGVSTDPTVVVRWNIATLEAIRRTHLGPPMVARALAVAHTAMFDAWAAYDERAVGTRFGGSLRRPARERTQANKEMAISFAAYRALVDLFPSEKEIFDSLMLQLGYELNDLSTDPTSPTGIGNLAAAAVISFRHNDGSNQLGDLAPGSYSDYTGYQPVNSPSQIVDPNHWQPLIVQNSEGLPVAQRFVAPQWDW